MEHITRKELNNLIAGTKDITDNIAADKSVTINLDCSNLEAAAGDKIVIPGKSDATINLVFTNKAKKNEGLVIADDALDAVTVTFPEGEFGDVAFEMPYSTLTLASAGASTLGKTSFNVNKNNKSELATTIGSGITINAIKTWYKDATGTVQYTGSVLAKDGAKVVALVFDADRFGSSNEDTGYYVPRVYTDLSKGTSLYVKDAYVAANNISIGAYKVNDAVVVNKITIAEGDSVTINGAMAAEIVGAGNGAYLKNFNSNSTAKYSNLTIYGNNRWYTAKGTYEKCTMLDFSGITLTQASATGLKFTQDKTTWTDIEFPVTAGADATSFKYTFDSCEFPEKSKVYAWAEGDPVLDKDGNPIKKELYEYYYNDPKDGWKWVSDVEKFTDIPDSIRMGTTKDYSVYYKYTYEPKVYNFKDLKIVPAFKSCKYNSVAVSDKNALKFVAFNSLSGADGKEVATTTQVEIEGKLYKRISTTAGYLLIEE